MYIQGEVLRVKTLKRRRNRLIVALLMPAVIFLWVVGWSLYWIGHQRDDKPVKHAKASQDSVRLDAVVFEDQPEIIVQ